MKHELKLKIKKLRKKIKKKKKKKKEDKAKSEHLDFLSDLKYSIFTGVIVSPIPLPYNKNTITLCNRNLTMLTNIK